MRQAKRLTALFTSLLLLGAALYAAPKQVKGKITDGNDGSPLAGVAVIDKTSQVSALTDEQGFYSITASEGDVLLFSLLGLKEKELTVGKSSVIDVVLEPDAKVLDDVLVVAYGTSTKESFTGSAETIRTEKLLDRPATDISKMLDGQVAGVMTTSGSGQPGSGADIVIRGFGSINASQSPLIVVDGIAYDGDLSSLNSADIESISILKDASAGALYGARGANGVVIVTTRSGDNDKLHLSLGIKGGINSRAIPEYETMDAAQYLEHMYKAAYNDFVYTEGLLPSEAAEKTPAKVASLVMGENEKYNIFNIPSASLFTSDGKIVSGASKRYDENWIQEATAKCPVRQEYQLGLNGGGAKAKYLASLSYLKDEGTLKTTSFERYTARAGGDFKPYNWLKLGVNVGYSRSRSDFLGASGSESNNVWYSAMKMAPIYPVYEKDASGATVYGTDGKPVFDYGLSRPAGAQNNRNCVATLYDDSYYTISDNVSLRAYAGVNFLGFDFTTNFGADIADGYESTLYNRNNGNAAGTGRLSKESAKTTSYTWNQILSYKKKFASRHDITAMLGHEFYNYNNRYLVAERTGFPFDSFDDLALGATISEGNSASDNYSIDSWFARLNYSYADKYYLDGSFRMDASSRFEASNRWGAFWSAGASWRISQEDFLKDAGWMNNLTLKLSYGVQGNDNVGSYYAWQSLYSLAYPNASRSSAIIASLENRNVTWEKNGNLNAGVEFRFFNAFKGTVEFYSRKTTDLLLSYPMAVSTGFSSYYANAGSMVNSGVDLTLGYDIINRDSLFWNVTLMASTLSNKVLKLTGNSDDIVSGNYIIREGEALRSFWLSKSAGVDPTTGAQLYWAYRTGTDGKMIPGSEYVTSDATAASSSKYVMGSRIPDLYGSFSTSARFKGFDVNLLFTYSIGGKVYDSVYASLMEPSYVGQACHVNALRSWSSPGQITDVPRASTDLVTVASDRFLLDASYFSIKSVTLGYTLPSSLTRKAKMETVRFYLSGDGLWLFSSLRGLDPQASFTGSTGYSYTPARTVTLGLDLKF